MTTWIYGAWAFVAGVLIPIMATLNGGLGRTIGSPAWATVVLLSVGLIAALAYALTTGAPPALAVFRQAPPAQFAAGLAVAFYVLSATWLTPRFGVGPTILLVVVAQIFTSAAISQFGLLAAPRQPLGLQGAAGLALALAGVAMVQLRKG